MGTKLTAKTALTGLSGTDIGYVVKNPGGTPTSGKALLSEWAKAMIGGSDTQLQFNDAGAPAGSSKLSFNKTTGVVTENGLNRLMYAGALADDASYALPVITNGAKGSIVVGNMEAYAEFYVDNDGDVTLISNSSNVVAGADTDAKFCIGTAATQEPLQLKNRLGASKNINLILWYN
jgi:hypothetical protein